MDAAVDAAVDDAGAPALRTLSLRHDGPALHVTLDRPQSRNAMSLEMVDELHRVLAQAEASGTVRVLVLRGAGGHFCAGADLQDMARARSMPCEEGRDPIAEVNAAFGRLCAAYAGTGLATVAVLEGSVMGGGLGLACVVDVALAGDTARFRLPETSLGLVPAQIAPFLVERLGVSQARRLAVTGGELDASQALAIGLVHGVHALQPAGSVDRDAPAPATPVRSLDEALADTLARIQRCAPGAVAATKALMRRARHEAPESLVEDAARAFAQAARGPEGLEGVTAFLQKRPAAWAAPR